MFIVNKAFENNIKLIKLMLRIVTICFDYKWSNKHQRRNPTTNPLQHPKALTKFASTSLSHAQTGVRNNEWWKK